MSDKKLRKALIKLAHEKPELRADLMPLLRKEGGYGGGYGRPRPDFNPKIPRQMGELDKTIRSLTSSLDFIMDVTNELEDFAEHETETAQAENLYDMYALSQEAYDELNTAISNVSKAKKLLQQSQM
jgi:hypothetical protein